VVDGEVLVSVEHADGVAGIVRDGQVVCMSCYLDQAGTAVLDGYESSMAGLTGERSLKGDCFLPERSTLRSLIAQDAIIMQSARTVPG
jgi:hypothetical protein